MWGGTACRIVFEQGGCVEGRRPSVLYRLHGRRRRDVCSVQGV